MASGKRHQNLHAHQLWQQQRFFAGFLVAVGIVMTVLLIYQHQFNKAANVVWLLYVPSGLLLGGLFLYYRYRSHVRILDEGVKISTLLSSVVIDYNTIKSVKAMPLRTHFQDGRKRMVAPVMKAHIDKPALFIRVRGDEEQLGAFKKKLGARLMYEDTIAIPVPDADSVAWEIMSRLPERLGQNQGGGKRRKRRR
ncbi:MAG: hypothetical protein ABI334_00450 [Candidatus Dormiibacterota bacterium]